MTETQYARSGDVSIAWQSQGEGPVDVVLVPGIVSHVEAFHELPGYTRFVSALAASARVITFDKRGNGLSDRVAEAPSLASRMDDVRAVMDAACSDTAVVFGTSEGGPLSLAFAATHPERTRALVLFGGFARMLEAQDYPAGLSRDAYEAFADGAVAAWGTGEPLLRIFGPSLANARELRAIAARCERASATPTALAALWRMNASIDVRDVLPTVRVPTLVLHRERDRVVPVDVARWLAPRIDGAKLVVLPGDDHFPFVGDGARVVEEVASFLGSAGVVAARPALVESAPRHESPTDFARLFALASVDAPVEIGRFVVEGALGTGGMGAVFLAVDRDLGRRVAIKVMRGTDAASFQRFRREATAIARLSHPNVVQIHELGLDADAPFMVMEHVEGGPVSALDAVPWRRAAAIVSSAARGLGAAHARGIVHRDVKPANLLLRMRGGDDVKVADFGVAKLEGAEPLTGDGLVGTVGYLAPEQIQREAVDPRTDVYALGVTLFRLLTGVHPFPGSPAEKVAAALREGVPDPSRLAEVPRALADLVVRMGARTRDRRPPDGASTAEAIARSIGDAA